MLITKIETKDDIKIGYITHENELETKQNITASAAGREPPSGTGTIGKRRELT